MRSYSDKFSHIGTYCRFWDFVTNFLVLCDFVSYLWELLHTKSADLWFLARLHVSQNVMSCFCLTAMRAHYFTIEMGIFFLLIGHFGEINKRSNLIFLSNCFIILFNAFKILVCDLLLGQMTRYWILFGRKQNVFLCILMFIALLYDFIRDGKLICLDWIEGHDYLFHCHSCWQAQMVVFS